MCLSGRLLALHAKAIALNLGPKWGWQEKVWAMRGRFKTKEEREDGAGEMSETEGKKRYKISLRGTLGTAEKEPNKKM